MNQCISLNTSIANFLFQLQHFSKYYAKTYLSSISFALVLSPTSSMAISSRMRARTRWDEAIIKWSAGSSLKKRSDKSSTSPQQVLNKSSAKAHREPYLANICSDLSACDLALLNLPELYSLT